MRMWRTKAALVAMLASGAACTGDSPATVEQPVRFRLDPEMVALVVPQDTLLRALSTLPGRATGSPLIWRSDNPAVATVSAEGRVRAVAPGNTRIVASSRTDSAEATVRVAGVVCVPLVTAQPTTLSATVGQRLDIPWSMQGCALRPATVWSFVSRDTTVLRVAASRDSVATLEAVRAGFATLEVTRTDALGHFTQLVPVTVR
ncbi:MAG: Ig-like domain-containing protein [Gemmatimonadaceae bacterium]|nr:Ig-like domain-containing protein [Gemmatimonadaceae bacterium]